MSSSKASLKLLIHKPSRKILFGQADKKFIDFLFTILALPVATIYNILSTETMVGPLRNLYHSVQNLDTDDFQEKYQKNINFLLKPKVQISRCDISSISQLLPIESSVPQGIYQCYRQHGDGRYATSSDVRCFVCNNAMGNGMQLVPSSPDDKLMMELMMKEGFKEKMGYVKDKISYMVMDDLTVKPMSAMSAISMLAQFDVDDATLIEEKVVYLDHKQGLDLRRASICCSSTVLSDVCLPNIDFEDSNTILKAEEVVVVSKDDTIDDFIPLDNPIECKMSCDNN